MLCPFSIIFDQKPTISSLSSQHLSFMKQMVEKLPSQLNVSYKKREPLTIKFTILDNRKVFKKELARQYIAYKDGLLPHFLKTAKIK